MISFFGVAKKLEDMVSSARKKKVISFVIWIFVFFLLTFGTYLYAWGDEIKASLLVLFLVNLMAVLSLVIFWSKGENLLLIIIGGIILVACTVYIINGTVMETMKLLG